MRVLLVSQSSRASRALQDAVVRFGVRIPVRHVFQMPDLRRAGADFDVLLVDSNVVGDTEEWQGLRRARPSLSIAVISTLDRPEELEQVLQAGLANVVTQRQLHWFLLESLQRTAHTVPQRHLTNVQAPT